MNISESIHQIEGPRFRCSLNVGIDKTTRTCHHVIEFECCGDVSDNAALLASLKDFIGIMESAKLPDPDLL